jgi:hypothetical protein
MSDLQADAALLLHTNQPVMRSIGTLTRAKQNLFSQSHFTFTYKLPRSVICVRLFPFPLSRPCFVTGLWDGIWHVNKEINNRTELLLGLLVMAAAVALLVMEAVE